MAVPTFLFAACLAVSPASDRILAGDLAPAGFAASDPLAVIGWAPVPGVQRTFTAAELHRIAARLGNAVAPDGSVCVERRVAPPDPDRIRAALQAQVADGEVTLLDFSRAPIPDGALVFPRSGLRRAQGSLYWNGHVNYAGGRKFGIWAKIRMRTGSRVVVAASDLTQGRAIDAAQLRLEIRDDFFGSGLVTAPDQAVGKWPRRSIHAGTALAREWLEPAPEVSRGDAVKVDVWSGAVHLELEARAESTAARNGRVMVRNLANQRRFVARVEGKGRVSARPAGGASR